MQAKEISEGLTDLSGEFGAYVGLIEFIASAARNFIDVDPTLIDSLTSISEYGKCLCNKINSLDIQASKLADGIKAIY